LHMSLINDYLNGYSGKLSLSNGGAGEHSQKIKLDKQNFEDYASSAKSGQVNPYIEYLSLKKEMKVLQREAITKHKQFLVSPQNIKIEEQELKSQLIELTKQYEANKSVKMKLNYKKGISINNFENYKAVMT
jgi:hypothetical protein